MRFWRTHLNYQFRGRYVLQEIFYTSIRAEERQRDISDGIIFKSTFDSDSASAYPIFNINNLNSSFKIYHSSMLMIL